DVVLVPAAAPYATRQERNRSWLDVAYTFDPGDYQRGMRVTVRGVRGAPELWDAFAGTRSLLPPIEETADGVVVEIPFDTGPAALLIWPEQATEAAVMPSSTGEASLMCELNGEWSVTIEPTIDNRFGDLARPAHPGAPPVQTWRFQHRIEAAGQDGLAEGWQSGVWLEAQEVTATFGPQGWWTGPLSAEQAPAPLQPSGDGHSALQADGWQPAIYSSSRGVLRDPIHLPTLGPKGHVPEEFLMFGRVLAGHSVQFRTGVWMEDETALTLALGAPTAKQLWINGAEVTGATPGYLWLAPVRLKAGFNLIEFRLTAEQNLNLRASWALVRAPARYARPEWMTTPDEPVLHSRVSFSCDIDIPFTPERATLQVGADAPCRVLVNGVEIGRQGGFDPYHSLARVQPYPVSNFRQGRNRIELETQDVGRKAAVLADGVAISADRQRFTWSSGPAWQVSRDHAPVTPVQLRRRQWADMMYDFVNAIFVDMDPAFSHLWRRPHPLPQAAWLEDQSADDTVVAVEADPFGGATRVEWLRWRLPPGAQELNISIVGRARIWIDGVEHEITEQGVVHPGDAPTAARVAVMRVETTRGNSGGRLLRGPVSYRTGEGRMRFGLWAEQGLESYAGGIRYRTVVHLEARPQGKVWLDLGRVRGTAEVWVNGRSAGVRVLSPYRFDVTALLQAGENQVEVLVLNTLAPYLNVQSPTFYVFPGQCNSGLIGPVVLLQQ
ncbi:MAG: glycosylhydrolase-like jelly roll fold domain-containing protein, partial [Caldilinea sp.]